MLITYPKEIPMKKYVEMELNKKQINFSLFYEITEWEMLTLKLCKKDLIG